MGNMERLLLTVDASDSIFIFSKYSEDAENQFFVFCLLNKALKNINISENLSVSLSFFSALNSFICAQT